MLGKNVKKNMEELYADNQKKGKERGANGKPRSHEQMIAISMKAAEMDKSHKLMGKFTGKHVKH